MTTRAHYHITIWANAGLGDSCRPRRILLVFQLAEMPASFVSVAGLQVGSRMVRKFERMNDLSSCVISRTRYKNGRPCPSSRATSPPRKKSGTGKPGR